jgi:cell division septation protein DedD
MTMLKYAALLFNSLALLIYQFFFADPITITQNLPASAKAGSEFVVELTINKGTTGGFAKLQQDLPEGFIAVDKGENNGGSFTFSAQSVKIIWMSLPSDKEFKIRYTVKTVAEINGDRTIAGKFSYVSDNVKQTVEIAPATINIIGAAAAKTDPTPQPESTNTTTPTPAPAEPTQLTSTTSGTTTTPVTANLSGNEGLSVSCTRKVPLTPGNEFTVELNINKGNLTGFAKLLETLPTGFTASAGESKGASFSFSDQKVKFVWVSMPTEPEFKVTYKITSTVDPKNQPIDGIFSYIENDETKKYTIATTIIGTEPGTTPPPIAANVTPEKKEEPVATPPVTPAETLATAKPTETTTPVTTPTETVTAQTTTPVDNTKVLSASTVPVPNSSVNYRVQIAALHKAVEANALATRYNLYEPVITEMAQGFTKYTVGSHKEYKSAHDARDIIKNKGVVGPFVTAYNSGKRITVQEALMITSQKWFR